MKLFRNSWHSFINMLRHNLMAKLAAVALAVVSWYAIRAATSFEAEITEIPLTVLVDDGWAVMERSARSVSVLFRGSKEDIRFLKREEIKVTLDAREREASGTLTAKLEPKNVNAPGSAKVVFIRPSEVTIRLDQEEDKQVPVRAEFQGVLPDGYEIEKVVCLPATVQLRGPRQFLKNLETLRTALIDLEGRIRSFRKLRVPVLQPGDLGAATIDPAQVSVEVTIVERSSTLDMEGLPLSVMSKQDGGLKYNVSKSKVSLTLKGRDDVLRTVERSHVRVYVDCSEIDAAAEYELPVKVTAPAGVSVTGLKPETVKVTVRQ